MKEYKVRLQAIDTPEKGQPYYLESKFYSASLITGKMVHVKVDKIDRYERIVGRVYYCLETDVKDVEAAMNVRNGWAWHYAYYNREKTLATQQKKLKMKDEGCGKTIIQPRLGSSEKNYNLTRTCGLFRSPFLR